MKARLPAYCLVVLLAGGVLVVSALRPALAASKEGFVWDDDGRLHYSLDVTVDLPSGALKASETVAYTNSSDEPLRELIFNFTPARNGALGVTSATVGGQPVAVRQEGVVLSLPLPESLAPGDSTSLTLEFVGTVPSPGDLRFGRASGVLALGNWYPTVSVHHSGQGWDRHRYVATGDAFVTEVADYDVRLTVTGAEEGAAIAYGGTLVGQNGSTWRIRSLNVRDFALALSARYVTATADVDGTRVNVYHLPEHTAGGAILLRTAVESVHWFNTVLGDYPYPQLSIAETTGNDPGWVGQEYPTIIFVGTGGMAAGGVMGDYLTYTVAHEVAHQWFYGMIGNDQVYEPWLDEAFATYLGHQYLRRGYPADYEVRWPGQRGRFQTSLATSGYRPVNSNIYDFSAESHYYAMVYSQGSLFLEELRQALGDDSFYGLLRDFVSRFWYKLPTGHAFLTMARQRAAIDVKPLLARYFTPSLYGSDLDWDVPAGHFYTQANGQALGASDQGYSVTNADGVPFWDEFRRLGGVDGLGYPASRRFIWDGFVCQVFQKGVLQWRPEKRSAYLVNVFDQMSVAGKDDWLRVVRSTPASLDWSVDSGRPWSEIVRAHQQLLDSFPAIKQRYFALADPITFYGLPMAPVMDMGSAYVLRAQRAVIQQWKVDVPWANAGQVTVANGGDVVKEAGLVSGAPLKLETAAE